MKKQGKDVNISKGKEIFEKELRKRKLPKDILTKDEFVSIMLKKSNFNSLEDAYENIGFGSISPLRVVNRLEEAYNDSLKTTEDVKVREKKKKSKEEEKNVVEVENIPNCKVKYAKCCLPIPGDDIIGYITFSNGVTIHRRDCKNLQNLDIGSRSINVKWKQMVKANFEAVIKVKANNRDLVIADVLKKMKDMKIDVNGINSRVTPDREIIIELVVAVPNTEILLKVLKEIKKIDSVFETKRIQ